MCKSQRSAGLRPATRRRRKMQNFFYFYQNARREYFHNVVELRFAAKRSKSDFLLAQTNSRRCGVNETKEEKTSHKSWFRGALSSSKVFSLLSKQDKWFSGSFTTSDSDGMGTIRIHAMVISLAYYRLYVWFNELYDERLRTLFMEIKIKLKSFCSSRVSVKSSSASGCAIWERDYLPRIITVWCWRQEKFDYHRRWSCLLLFVEKIKI